MMTSLLVYGYCVGVASSRNIEKKTWEEVAFRVIAGDDLPKARRIDRGLRDRLVSWTGVESGIQNRMRSDACLDQSADM